MGRFGHSAHLTAFDSDLLKELETTDDPGERSALLYALYRVLESQPGRRNEAYGYLDLAKETMPSSTDLMWEAWRVSGRRGPHERALALESLLGLLEHPADRAHCHLLRAKLFQDHFNDKEGAQRALEDAITILPESREAIWALVESAVDREDPPLLAKHLLALVSHTADPIMKAALLVEAADLKRRQAADPAEIADILTQALSQSEHDWSVLSAVRDLGAGLADWSLYEKALHLLAEAATKSLVPPDPGKPPGHGFSGFDATPVVAGAWFWYLGVIYEHRLKMPDRAIDALTRARALIPESRFLRREQARLLTSRGEVEEALALIAHDADDVEKGVLALAGGHRDLAASFALARNDRCGSLLGEILAETCGDDVPPPTDTADTAVISSWLDANPGHGEAAQLVRCLMDEGVAYPLLDLMAEEHIRDDESIASIAGRHDDEAWSHALLAVLGAPELRPDAFLNWANSTADQSLRATLTLMAAHLFEVGSGPRDTIDDLRQEADSLSRASVPPDAPFEPLPDNWRREADALVDLMTDADNIEAARKALFKRAMILEHALTDMDAAAKTLDDLIAISNKDVVAIWLGIRLACRRGDWASVADKLAQLIPLVPEDAGLIALFLAEIHLLALNDYSAALHWLDRAEVDADAATTETTLLYHFLTLDQMGGDNPFAQAFAKVETDDSPSDAELFPAPSVMEKRRGTTRAMNAAKQLSGREGNAMNQILFSMMNPIPFLDDGPPDFSHVTSSMRRLAGMTPPGPVTEALFVASSLIDGEPLAPFAIGDSAEAGSLETLWHAADLSTEYNEALLAAEAYCERVGLSPGLEENEWIDWILIRAESEEKDGNVDRALATIQRGLEIASDHPGLLESEARLAKRAGHYAEAADAHNRLARFYDSQEEKAYHLAQSAFILFDKLNNVRGAKRICEEAVRRVPGHAQANEILNYILHALGEERSENTRMERPFGGGKEEAPVNVQRMRDRRYIAVETADPRLAAHLDEIVMILSGKKRAPFPFSPIPCPALNVETVQALCEHHDERNPMREVARLASDVSHVTVVPLSMISEAIESWDVFDDDAIECWCNAWGSVLGIAPLTVSRAALIGDGIATFVPEERTLIIHHDLTCPLGVSNRFLLGRYLFRLSQGLAAFAETDILGPVEWMMALARAILGDQAVLPMPADAETAASIEVAISSDRKARLAPDLGLVIKESGNSLRAWAAAAVFSADRFGLLAAGSLPEVASLLAEETNGADGLLKMAKTPMKLVGNTPRLKELFSFSSSEAYLSIISRNDILATGPGESE